MTKEEFGKLAMFLKAAYEKDKFLASRESAEVWYALLKDIPYQVAQEAVMRHVRTCKFPPAPSEIIEQAVNAIEPEKELWSCAWESVQKAIQHYGTWGEPQALAMLEPLSRTIVKRLGYKNLCLSDNPTADRANFRTAYEQEQKREHEKALQPQGFRDLLAGSAFKMLE
jgi:hypothetical protein